jgi:uncharacterized delta-60 repeat protein
MALILSGICPSACGQVAGTLDTSFTPTLAASDQPVALALQPDEHIVVGGVISSVNGQPRNNLVRLHPDGSLEGTSTFDPGTGPDGSVGAIAIQPDGKILISGNFTSVNGEARNRLARLNHDGTLEDINTFNIGSGPDGIVTSVALQSDGKIFITGTFSSVNGEPRHGIARLLSNGAVEPLSSFDTSTSITSSVGAVFVQDDGGILLSAAGRPV